MFLLNLELKKTTVITFLYLQYKMFLLNLIANNEDIDDITIYNTKCSY